jgi:hypothetical protein
VTRSAAGALESIKVTVAQRWRRGGVRSGDYLMGTHDENI